jgi:DNA primase catalytic core
LGLFSEAQIDTVRQRADIVTVIGERVALQKKGPDFWGCCPFHDEKTPSFSVTPRKQAWYCHGACKRGGDVFKFVEAIEKVKFPEAVRLVARRFGVAIEDETPEQKARARRKADLLDALNKTVTFYRRQLTDGKSESATAARALLERRGVTSEAQARFSLGVAPAGNALAKAIQKKPAAEARAMLPLLKELGLLRQDGRDFFSNRLLFPIQDEGGRFVGFGGRRLDEQDEPKFINSRDVPGIFEKKKVLYGLAQARDTKPRPERLVVVEGYIDVVIAHQAGCTNVVGALSTGFGPDHAALARRFVEGRICLLFDGDAAGQAANRRVLEALLETDVDARVAALPEKMDPDDFILKEGKEAFEKLVRDGSRDVFQFLVDVVKTSDAVTPQVVAECARLLGKFRDDIRHQLSLKYVADRLGFPEELLRRKALESREASRKLVRPGPDAQRAAQVEQDVIDNTHPQVRAILGPHACAGEPFEVTLLEALVAVRGETNGIELDLDGMTAGPLRDVARAVCASGGQGADGFETRLLGKLQDKSAALDVATRLLARVAEQESGENKKNWQAEVEGGARALAARRKNVRAAALSAEIDRANDEGDFALVDRLVAEKTKLAREARGGK